MLYPELNYMFYFHKSTLMKLLHASAGVEGGDHSTSLCLVVSQLGSIYYSHAHMEAATRHRQKSWRQQPQQIGGWLPMGMRSMMAMIMWVPDNCNC